MRQRRSIFWWAVLVGVQVLGENRIFFFLPALTIKLSGKRHSLHRRPTFYHFSIQAKCHSLYIPLTTPEVTPGRLSETLTAPCCLLPAAKRWTLTITLQACCYMPKQPGSGRWQLRSSRKSPASVFVFILPPKRVIRNLSSHITALHWSLCKDKTWEGRTWTGAPGEAWSLWASSKKKGEKKRSLGATFSQRVLLRNQTKGGWWRGNKTAARKSILALVFPPRWITANDNKDLNKLLRRSGSLEGDRNLRSAHKWLRGGREAWSGTWLI